MELKMLLNPMFFFFFLLLLPIFVEAKVIGDVIANKLDKGFAKFCSQATSTIVDPLPGPDFSSGSESDPQGWNGALLYEGTLVNICPLKENSCAVKKLMPVNMYLKGISSAISKVAIRFMGSDKKMYSCNFITCRNQKNINSSHVSCSEYVTDREVEDYVAKKISVLRGAMIGEIDVLFQTDKALGALDLVDIIVPTLKLIYDTDI
jgi:hypothetical protein